jgi:hypothetical protein
MATGLPMTSRSCGECEECCRVIGVEELKKPFHTTCAHQTGKGCAIYGNHPSECKTYTCVWRQGILSEEMRPDKIGILVDAEGGDEWLVIQECRRGALDTKAGRELLALFKGAVGLLRRGVRIEPYEAHKGASDTEKGVLGRYDEIAPKVFLHVGAESSSKSAGTSQPTHRYGTSRNDLCPCRSGKKYKKCCMRR